MEKDEPHQQQPPHTVVYMAPMRSSGGGGAGAFDFNENDPRYKCCCGCMHVRNGAILLAIVELVFSVLGVLAALAGGGGRNRMGTSSVSFANCVVTIVVSSSMLFGLKKTRRYFLVPHVIVQFFSIIGFFVGAIFFAISAMGSGSSHNGFGRSSDEYPALVYGIAAILCLIIVALECWFFSVVWRAFRYLRDKQTARFQGQPMILHGGGNV